ncbi:MAG: hypothetical protein ACOC16_03650 [Nanoarchaeota archaeon]
MENIIYKKTLPKEKVEILLKKIVFRGLYDKNGNNIKPYKNAKFTLVTVYPPKNPTDQPRITKNNITNIPLFTAQPTIYKTQTDIMKDANKFLKSIGRDICCLNFEAIEYYWEGRGDFHMLPPIIEKQTYPLKKGYFDLKKLSQRFKNTYVKDARGNLHDISKGILGNYYVDKDTNKQYMRVFNPNADLINYGLKFNSDNDFYVICDGSHRLDYAIEVLNQPMNAILVEPIDENKPLFPYYAFPMPFMPLIRLTSKDAEKLYNIERDKIHLLNFFLKKALHYDWTKGGLLVSKVRNADIKVF